MKKRHNIKMGICEDGLWKKQKKKSKSVDVLLVCLWKEKCSKMLREAI